MSILINCAVDLRLAPLQTDVGLIDVPGSTNWTEPSLRSVAEQRQEALEQAVTGAAVNRTTTFGKPSTTSA